MKSLYIRNIPLALYLELQKLKLHYDARTWKDLLWKIVEDVDVDTSSKRQSSPSSVKVERRVSTKVRGSLDVEESVRDLIAKAQSQVKSVDRYADEIRSLSDVTTRMPVKKIDRDNSKQYGEKNVIDKIRAYEEAYLRKDLEINGYFKEMMKITPSELRKYLKEKQKEKS